MGLTENFFLLSRQLINKKPQPQTKVDEDAKWKTRELRQIRTADPIGMGRKSCQCTTYFPV